MKKIFLGCLLSLLCSVGTRGQGSDVIFWIDNSGSINNNPEYPDMQTSIQAIMNNVLACNPLNRVTVIQYDFGRTFIESQFQNIPVNFARRYNNSGGDSHRSLAAINDAINAIPNVDIDINGQQTLTFTPGNARVVYFFTDAARNGDCTDNFPIGDARAFSNYTNFKNNWNATFVVTMIPQNLVARNAGAAIASLGGNYNGIIEAYPLDPDGPGQAPRFFLSNGNFLLNAADIALVTGNLCSITAPPCVATIVRLPISDDVSVQDNQEASDNIIASNTINNGAIAIYHAGNEVVLTSGFHSANGSRFRGYIEPCTGDFEGRQQQSKKSSDASSVTLLKIYPNPVANDFKIENSSPIKAITIATSDGKTIYSEDFYGDQTSVQINISNLKSGFYVLNVKTAYGETIIKKIIKQ